MIHCSVSYKFLSISNMNNKKGKLRIAAILSDLPSHRAKQLNYQSTLRINEKNQINKFPAQRNQIR